MDGDVAAVFDSGFLNIERRILVVVKGAGGPNFLSRQRTGEQDEGKQSECAHKILGAQTA
jgi:hypothetical protein